MTASPVLKLNNLTKRFGQILAVNRLSFEVYEGDIFGFLGPNGAGKSTTLYMIAGLVHPTSGTIEVLGQPHTNYRHVRSRVGMLIEVPAFYEHLSARKNLEVLGRLHVGLPPTRFDEVLERVGLLDRADDLVREFSHGMKQRLGLAQTLLHRPRLLLLDEPTSGLDPEGSVSIWKLLRSLVAEEKITVFVSSHLLHEVEENCNRIAVINQGVLVACDEVRKLLFFSKEDFLLMFEDPSVRAQAEIYLRSREGIEIFAAPPQDTQAASLLGEDTVWIRTKHGLMPTLLAELVERKLTPRAVIPQRKTLRQFFFELTRRQPSAR
ncbi:MAG: ABC transporter ATP-binding protein [Candidatus Sumerlaeaceae bacterium]|jgi:ABC-2 type transport system ATP-binding protein